MSPDGIKQRIVMTLDVGLSLRDILADFVQSSRSLPTSRASNGLFAVNLILPLLLFSYQTNKEQRLIMQVRMAAR